MTRSPGDALAGAPVDGDPDDRRTGDPVEADSVWRIDAPPRSPASPLAGDLEVDVAIVGGGLAGISTAYHLLRRQPSLDVVLLEAETLGAGASGRNGGLVLSSIAGSRAATAHAIRREYELTSGAIDELERIVRDERLEVPFSRSGTLDLYTTEAGARAAAGEVARANAAGVPLELLDGRALGERIAPRGGVAGVFDPAGGGMNCLAYIRALAARLESRGLRIHEGTRVERLERGPTVTLHTRAGVVRAAAVFVVVNAWAPQLGLFRRRIIPVHSLVIATEPLPAERWAEIGWRRGAGFADDQPRLAYASMTARGQLVFGGGSNAAYRYRYGSDHHPGAALDRGHRAVAAKLRESFPGAADVDIAHRWSGAIGMTLTRMCSVGVLGEHRNVYYALGFSGHGITMATLSGRVLADLHAGEHEPWRDAPFYQYRPPPFPPEPLRWLGYQAFTRVTGRSPRREMDGG